MKDRKDIEILDIGSDKKYNRINNILKRRKLSNKKNNRYFNIVVYFIILIGAFLVLNVTTGIIKNSINNSKYDLSKINYMLYDADFMKEAKINDSIIILDLNTKIDVSYNFYIEKGNVFISNNKKNHKYKINSIQNAKKLIAFNVGNSPKYAGLFILSGDNKLYSISLYDNHDKIIIDCKDFENVIKEYNFDSEIISISGVSYHKKDGLNTTGGILIKLNNKEDYVLIDK